MTDLTGVGWTFKTYNRVDHIKYVESQLVEIDLSQFKNIVSSKGKQK